MAIFAEDAFEERGIITLNRRDPVPQPPPPSSSTDGAGPAVYPVGRSVVVVSLKLE